MKRTLLLLGILLPLLGWGQTVKIGDILCVQGSDTLIVSPHDYTGGGIGVVFYVDESGQHGWIIHPQIQAHQIYWSNMYELPWGLTGWQSIRDAIYDLDGYDNTGFLRAASQYDHSRYPGAWAVDYEHGWYWPSLGQLNILYGSIPVVNNSLKQIGGTLMQGPWVYWSSSTFGFDNDCALYYASSGAMGAVVKTRTDMPQAPMDVRSIRNF
jgi:hypothetical protein